MADQHVVRIRPHIVDRAVEVLFRAAGGEELTKQQVQAARELIIAHKNQSQLTARVLSMVGEDKAHCRLIIRANPDVFPFELPEPPRVINDEERQARAS